jgi:hypothetical protein
MWPTVADKRNIFKLLEQTSAAVLPCPTIRPTPSRASAAPSTRHRRAMQLSLQTAEARAFLAD